MLNHPDKDEKVNFDRDFDIGVSVFTERQVKKLHICNYGC